MNHALDLPVDILVGGSLGTMNCQPLPAYSPAAIEFLSELSKSLFRKLSIREYPDIAAFAYWCRKANLSRLASDFDVKYCHLGRGLALHIAPANVPVNFAFSFAFGLLAGNANIVRIPGANFPQVGIICEAIRHLFDSVAHDEIAAMNRFIKYERNDDITAALSANCHARVLWGGDSTISHFRTMPTMPRCVDVVFADRFSLCLIGAESVLLAEDNSLKELASGFYNDVFLLDQNACSSPHLIIWLGKPDQIEMAMKRFWAALRTLLENKYELAPIQTIDKFVHLCRTAITLDAAKSADREANLIYRVRLDDLPPGIERHRGQFGFFYEYLTDDLGCLKNIVNERYQTVTCFGIDQDFLAEFIKVNRLSGIDRIVPVGKALDIGVYWDGYDLISTLSRIIHTM